MDYFGLIEEDTGRYELWFIEFRDAATIMGVVGYHMEGENNTVHTDGWAAYRNVDWAAAGCVR